jgi:hypothetical protein
MFARRYGLAKLEQAREGLLIQVIDAAAPPNRNSGPRREYIAKITAAVTFVLTMALVILGHLWQLGTYSFRASDSEGTRSPR